MYALLPQMQNRYSIWAAAFSAAMAAFSVDGLMLFLLLNAINFLDTALDMYFRAQGTPTAQKYMPMVMPLFPDLGWMVLLISGIYLYLALRRDRRTTLVDWRRSLVNLRAIPASLMRLVRWLKTQATRSRAAPLPESEVAPNDTLVGSMQMATR
jgi:membrane protease YdiL (CAAX protease family)